MIKRMDACVQGDGITVIMGTIRREVFIYFFITPHARLFELLSLRCQTRKLQQRTIDCTNLFGKSLCLHALRIL